MKLRRGEIWEVRFDPSEGDEIRKTRPAVIMTQFGAGRLDLQIVVPITDWKPHYRSAPWMTHLFPSALNGLRKESTADAFQVKSVANGRFIRKLGI